MSDQYDPSAASAPAAASPQGAPSPAQPVPQASPPNPSGVPAPAGTSAPVDQVQTPEPPPQPSPEEIEGWRSKAAEADRLRAEKAQADAEMARQAELSARQQELSRLDQWADQYMTQAYDYATRLDSDQERQAYIARAAQTVRQQERQFHEQQQNQLLQQQNAREMAAYTQQYPDWLKKQFDLDDATVEMIRQYDDPKTMTVAAQLAQRHNAQLAELRKITEQSYAQSQANAMRASGVTTMGGLNASTAGAPRITADMPEAERDARFLRAIGMTS